MQVILLENIRKLGAVGDTVTVKNGYARNYLIPNQKALYATQGNIDYFEAQKKDIEARNNEKRAEAETLKAKIHEQYVIILQQAGDDDRLYGAVTVSSIATALSDKIEENIERRIVALHDPIKYIGIHKVEVHPHADVIAELFINVARTSEEAEILERKFKKGEIQLGGTKATSVENVAEAAFTRPEENKAATAEDAAEDSDSEGEQEAA